MKMKTKIYQFYIALKIKTSRDKIDTKKDSDWFNLDIIVCLLDYDFLEIFYFAS